MEPEARYTIVGAAVLLLVGLLAAAVIWLRGSGEGADARQYKIYFERQSLEGLELRSAVTMRGVRVGSVTGIRFSAVRPASVEVSVALDPTTPVRQSTQASVDRHLLTGLATVRLANTTEASPLLAAVPDGEARPVIAEGESSMQHVSDTLTQLAQNADETIQRLNAALSPENRAALGESVQNLRRASQRAEASMAKLDAALGSVGQAADEVRSMASSVRDDVHRLEARYGALGSDATVAVRDIGEAARRISADVARLTQRADALVAGSEDELRTSARALRSAADAVGAAAGRLNDPQQLIYGPAPGALGPGEGQR